jgi:hypothetical protein
MLREKIVMMNQREYIEYVRKFAEAHGKHIWLGGKQELGVSVANEIAAFLKCGFDVTQNDYKNGITRLIDLYNDKYPLDEKYRNLCIGLIREV